MKELKHEGVKFKSGRYPHGSGERPHQHDNHLSATVDSLKKQNYSEADIARAMGMSTGQLRARLSAEKEAQKQQAYYTAITLKDKGMSYRAIAERLGYSNESSVRSLISSYENRKKQTIDTVKSLLKESVDKDKYIDVGSGVETYLGVSKVRLNAAVQSLVDEGYQVYSNIKVMQAGTGNYTWYKILVPPGTSYSETYQNRDKYQIPNGWVVDDGQNYKTVQKPKSIDSSRVFIRYAEDGGTDKDGVIELRRGVEDLSLGYNRYAQVRIAVDGTHYLKGMALYSDDIPDGYDIIFNSNKKRGTAPYDVFKKIEGDPDRPFKSVVHQQYYKDSDGKEQLSALNIVKGEGEVGGWSRNLPSQFLSKQSPELAKRQLELAYSQKEEAYKDAMKITNPVVKRQTLLELGDLLDSAAVELKGAAMPRQATKFILPVPSLSDKEIYAPGYKDGEEVVLIRFPHGGTFEIPRLKVNNRQAQAVKTLEGARDAVGINPRVAEKLSGADFDGDTVLVIPTSGQKIRTTPSLKQLEGFNPREKYYKEGMEVSDRTKQLQMGLVSNLITDMTIKGASDPNEYARAVRHSMVVIDAQKHHLDWKQSEIDNGIAELKEKYQGNKRAGASTLISRSSSDQRVGTRKETIDPETGKKIYEYKNETYTDKKGKTVLRTTKSTKMFETDDAFSLSSGTKIESIYASHANKLKALANKARKSALEVKNTPYSPTAKATYKKEVDSLDSKLVIALKNKPLERMAQAIASKEVATIRKANPDMSADDVKKARNQAIAAARIRTGAKKTQIYITDNEWKAIQSGAITTTKLTSIISNADKDRIRELSQPRTTKAISSSKVARAKQMFKSHYTYSEIAEVLGLSSSTVEEIVN